jgi:hypothetical protein
MKVILGKLNKEWLRDLATEAVRFCSHVDAAVAYVTSRTHPLLAVCKEHQLRLTLYGLLDENGAVSPVVIKELLAWGPSRAEVRLVNGNFHAKVIWWRQFGAYVGSANLTEKAWGNNVEAGIFYTEHELLEYGIGDELEGMFEYLAEHSISATNEVVVKLQELAEERRSLDSHQKHLKAEFDKRFGHLAEHRGLTSVPPRGQRPNRAAQRFVAEWMQTLQLMRGLREEFVALGLRPTWVDDDAHPAVHFDQFLHAYYYDYVRGGLGPNPDEDDESPGLDKVEASFRANRNNPAAALRQAVRWWASLPKDCYGEEEFIRKTASEVRERLNRDAVKRMDLEGFQRAFVHVNAFRMHARQMKNSQYALPPDHKESIDARVTRLCKWLWEQRSKGGKTARDVLEFVLWGPTPTDMEQRLWLATHSDEYRIQHFGQSSLGEAVGWARPDDYPPRNNRTNKALRALGHDIKLFSNS